MLSTKSGAFSLRRFLAVAGPAGHGIAAVALVGCDRGDDDDQAAPASTAQPAARRQQQVRQQVQQQAAQEQAAPPRTLRIAALGGGGPLGTYATHERIEAVREQLDLDDPAPIRYAAGSAAHCRAISAARSGSISRSRT